VVHEKTSIVAILPHPVKGLKKGGKKGTDRVRRATEKGGGKEFKDIRSNEGGAGEEVVETNDASKRLCETREREEGRALPLPEKESEGKGSNLEIQGSGLRGKNGGKIKPSTGRRGQKNGRKGKSQCQGGKE